MIKVQEKAAWHGDFKSVMDGMISLTDFVPVYNGILIGTGIHRWSQSRLRKSMVDSVFTTELKIPKIWIKKTGGMLV